MRSPQTMGVELPWLASLIFHLTLSLSDHFSGTFFSLQWPWPVGPRQAGQLSAGATAAKGSSRARKAARRFMRGVPREVAGSIGGQHVPACGVAEQGVGEV